MGSSNSNTGIGFVDNAVNATVNQVVNPAAKNVEKGISRQLMSYGAAIGKGNLNNLGNTLLETTAMGLTGGLSLAAGYKAGENNVDRLTTETANKAAQTEADQIASDAQAAADKKQSDINDIVNSMVESRRRQPGKAATLLTTIGAANSYGPLLTGR